MAVRELHVVTQDEVVVHGAVGILGDLQISDAVIGVVGAVVVLGLALDALQNDGAGAVRGQQADLGHGLDVLVIGRGSKEGRELAAEGSVANHQGGVIGRLFRLLVVLLVVLLGVLSGIGIGVGIVVAAAGQHTDAHSHRQKQSKDFGASFHEIESSFKILNYINGPVIRGHSSQVCWGGLRSRPQKGRAPFWKILVYS